MITELNNMFKDILSYAERNQDCLRKAVGCAAITLNVHKQFEPMLLSRAHNGPSREGQECTNEVGNCGCSHAEPRLVQEVFKQGHFGIPRIMLCTYSPCTNCANIVIDSGLFVGCIYQVFTDHDPRGEKFIRQSMNIMTVVELNKLTEREVIDKIKTWISNRDS